MSKKSDEEHIDLLKGNLKSMIRARYPYIWIQTQEESRILNIIEEIAGNLNRKCYVYDYVQMWQYITAWTCGDLDYDEPELPSCFSAKDVYDALKNDVISCIESEERFLLIFPDFHFSIEDTSKALAKTLIRVIKWLNPKIRNSYISIIFYLIVI